VTGADHHPPHATGRHGLTWAFALTVAYAAVEAAAGWWSGSLTLFGDAGHMITDATALGIAAFASWVARQPPSARHSFGLVRAEAVAALVNSLFMLLIVGAIAYQAVSRLHHPQPVAGGTVMIVAALGLLVNVAVAMLLHHGAQDLNTRAALLHVIGDLLGSVAALVAGGIIYFTAWTPIDPLLSLLICALILISAVRLLREVLHVIMEGVPPYIDLPTVGRALAGVSNVSSIHDLHIWTLSSGRIALSAHVVLEDMDRWDTILGDMRTLLLEDFAIDHVTLQPEPAHAGTRVIHWQPGGPDTTP